MTRLPFEVFGRHRGAADLRDSCGLERLGASDDDT
jgi:hypothetical protein